MKNLGDSRGLTLVEVIVSTAIFALIAIAVYGAFQMVLKAVYVSRINIIETALLDERLEIARNLPFSSVGIINGLPVGVIPHTTTTYRNGIPFLVTTAVRTIDDPFDGTLGGTPNDTAPADYKLVEINVKCLSCEHPVASNVSTMIAPKDLEGDTANGAIFVYVTDSNHNPVVGANVHVENTTTASIIIDDVTDKDGALRIIDTPTGTFSYAVTVWKQGFSTDYTVASSSGNPTPSNLPLTVSKQQISEAYLSIDQLGSLSLHTVDQSCDAVANASLVMSGSKLIGTPNVKKYSQSLQTDGSGNLDINNLEFDTYSFTSTTGFDVAGSIPMVPLDLKAGSHGDVTLVLSPHTANSLLAKVVGSDNTLPGAIVQLKKNNALIGTQTTNGTFSQNDWSDGVPQTYYSILFPKRFDSSLGVDTVSAPGNITLTKIGNQYTYNGWLQSSIFDVGKKVELKNVLYTSASQPPETGDSSILLQLAYSNTSTPSSLTNFTGPDGTATTYYTSTSTIVNTGGNPYRYFRYEVFLSTASSTLTPVFSSFAITYTNGCTPPGQVFFSGLTAGTYELDVSSTGYNYATTSVDVSGTASSTVTLYPSS